MKLKMCIALPPAGTQSLTIPGITPVIVMGKCGDTTLISHYSKCGDTLSAFTHGEYKAIALKLGELGIVPREFANKGLKAMAGYRNRLTHFYADVTPAELQRTVRSDLGDFDTFAAAIKTLLENPERFGIAVE